MSSAVKFSVVGAPSTLCWASPDGADGDRDVLHWPFPATVRLLTNVMSQCVGVCSQRVGSVASYLHAPTVQFQMPWGPNAPHQ